jgi:hypothetical protein
MTTYILTTALAAALLTYLLTRRTHKRAAAVERKAWERKVAAAEERADEADEATEDARTAARSSERVMHRMTKRALDAELGIGLLHMEVERLDALVAERAAVVPIRKRAAKAVSRG